MVYAAAFTIGVLMCVTLAASIGVLLRDTVDADKLMQGALTLSFSALATGLVMYAYPDSAVAIAIAYALGSGSTLLAFVFSGLVNSPRVEPSVAPMRPDSFLKDPSSTLH